MRIYAKPYASAFAAARFQELWDLILFISRGRIKHNGAITRYVDMWGKIDIFWSAFTPSGMDQ